MVVCGKMKQTVDFVIRVNSDAMLISNYLYNLLDFWIRLQLTIEPSSLIGFFAVFTMYKGAEEA